MAGGLKQDYVQTVVAIVISVLALALFACDRPPAADSLREWTASDHHSSDDDKASPGPAGPAGPAGSAGGRQAARGGPAGEDVTRLVDLAWRQQCSSCHGPTGKGDGQLGPMVRAPDLTRDEWQSQVSDAEIATVIKKGKGKMPSFDVPDPIVQGLVARVRAARGR